MDQFLTFTITGLVTAALYAVAASGLVVTYTTSGIFNFAHGAFGMFAAFAYWQFRQEWGWPAPLALMAVLGVGAPVFGAAVERIILRGLRGAPEVIQLVVSVSLLFGVYQAALELFPPEGTKEPRLLRRAEHRPGRGQSDLARRHHGPRRPRHCGRAPNPAVPHPRRRGDAQRRRRPGALPAHRCPPRPGVDALVVARGVAGRPGWHPAGR